MNPAPSKEFLRGVRDEAPILVGVAPLGMIYGVLALRAGIQASAAQAMSAIVFAGSAQFLFVQLAAASAPAWVVLLTVLVVNLRHALYSASLSPYFRRLGPRWKTVLSYLLTDEAYAVAVSRFVVAPEEACRSGRWYFLGAGLALWTAWQASTAVGVFVGAQIPAAWSLDFSLALTFIALVVPVLRDRAAVAAALAAGITAVAAAGLPYKLGLVAAAAAGILAGLLVEGRGGKR